MTKKHGRPSAHEVLNQFVLAAVVSRLLQIVAKLDIADELEGGPLTADNLAKRVGAHGPSLHRALRALSSVGIFSQTADDRFRLTPLSQLLRTGRTGSMRDWLQMANSGYIWRAFEALDRAIVNGENPFACAHGVPLFAYLQRHPNEERAFSSAMASFSATENLAVARAYSFGQFSRLVDVGGAHGHLLATILRRNRKLRGVLFDRPEVVATAAESGFITARGIRERCEAVGGDCLQSVPSGCDAYLMKYVIHDFDDTQSAKILSRCRESMAPAGKILVVDHVILPGNRDVEGKFMDVTMMAVTGGRERTRKEFGGLFARARLRLTRVIPTACPLSIVEAVRA